MQRGYFEETVYETSRHRYHGDGTLPPDTIGKVEAVLDATLHRIDALRDEIIAGQVPLY